MPLSALGANSGIPPSIYLFIVNPSSLRYRAITSRGGMSVSDGVLGMTTARADEKSHCRSQPERQCLDGVRDHRQGVVAGRLCGCSTTRSSRR
jgi:hypothetical protein